MKIIIQEKKGEYTYTQESSKQNLIVSPSRITMGLQIITAGLVDVFTKNEVRAITGYDRNFSDDFNNIFNS